MATSRARRLVALARSLQERPAAASAFAAGSLSEDQVGVVCAHVDAAHDAEATAVARRCTLGQLRRILPSLVPAEPAPDPTPDPAPVAGEEGESEPGLDLEEVPGRRQTTFGHGDDGRWWARIVLPADEGSLVQKALEAARHALFGGDDQGSVAKVSWSDALVHLSEAALGNMEGTGRLPGDRFQVVFHVDADDPARGRLHLGPLLPASLRDLLVCDATARVVLERKGTPVHVLARRRTVDDRLRSLVEQRDGGCRVPGCGRRRWLHVHHLVHHDHGGPTLPANLCCLCPAHHRLHHAGRLGMAGDPTTPDGLVFTDRRGRPIGGPSPRPPGAPPAQAAAAFGLPAPRWDPPLGEPLDERWITWAELWKFPGQASQRRQAGSPPGGSCWRATDRPVRVVIRLRSTASALPSLAAAAASPGTGRVAGQRRRARRTTSAMCGVSGGGSMRGSTACRSTAKPSSSRGTRSSTPT